MKNPFRVPSGRNEAEAYVHSLRGYSAMAGVFSSVLRGSGTAIAAASIADLTAYLATGNSIGASLRDASALEAIAASGGLGAAGVWMRQFGCRLRQQYDEIAQAYADMQNELDERAQDYARSRAL